MPPHRSSTQHAEHWTEKRWRPLAQVRGRKGEIDKVYISTDTTGLLLIRHTLSVTDRRLREATIILDAGDFRWVVLVPERPPLTKRCDVLGLEVISPNAFRPLAVGAGINV